MKARGGTDSRELAKPHTTIFLLSAGNAFFINFWLLCLKMPITVRGKLKFCALVIFYFHKIFWGAYAGKDRDRFQPEGRLWQDHGVDAACREFCTARPPDDAGRHGQARNQYDLGGE